MNNIDFGEMDFEFLSEDEVEVEESKPTRTYKILIVDDDEEIHTITKVSLRGLAFESNPVELISVYSAKEAKEYMSTHTDTAIILLDVVMEKDDSGLEVVKYIRNDLMNHQVRIILRTGHPGMAPESDIIINYDINDYKSKTELTAQKLMTTVYACLRNYRDLMRIEVNRQGLLKVINATKSLFNLTPIDVTDFLNGLLSQLTSIIGTDDAMILINKHFEDGRLVKRANKHFVIAATGQYKKYLNKSTDDIDSDISITPYVKQINEEEASSLYMNDLYLGHHKSSHKDATESYIYMVNCKNSDLNENLISIFLENQSLALDNYLAEQMYNDSQLEILTRLSNIVEQRDENTGNHVFRVASISQIIASKCAIDDETMRYLKTAAMLHDIGKVGISDSILLKPSKLTEEEFFEMKKHTTLGYNLFKSAKYPLMDLSASIALMHHERWDGLGYPNGYSGEDIPLTARIVAIADVFDALTNSRPYKGPWSFDEAKAFIENNKCKMFDPKLVDIFIDNYDEIVQLINECNAR